MLATETPANKRLHVVIAGAGIAGLTAAIACAQRGFSVTVIEQAKILTEVGAGLQLQPNATRVLQALGLANDLQAISVLPPELTLREARTGQMITRVSLNNTVDHLPYCQIHRADLQGVLLQHAQANGATVYTDTPLVSLQQTPDQVSIKTLHGPLLTADVLIGADGVRSTTRQLLFGNEQPVFTGHVCYRGTVDASKLSMDITPGGIAGPGRHFVCYYLRNKQLVNFVAQHEEREWTDESWSTPGDVETLRQLYRNWDPQVDELLNKVESTFKWALYTRKPLPAWSAGRAGLIGDACHPTLPNLASGAGMAIEDGYIIADLLNKYSDDIPKALETFYQLRFERCTKIQKASERMAKFFHIKRPLERVLTYSAARMATKLAPNLIARKMTWTHHYNALTAVGDD